MHADQSLNYSEIFLNLGRLEDLLRLGIDELEFNEAEKRLKYHRHFSLTSISQCVFHYSSKEAILFKHFWIFLQEQQEVFMVGWYFEFFHFIVPVRELR